MRNKNGAEDLRRYAPFNVDRAPTGQLVKKGSIDNPIQRYQDSKSKIRKEKGKSDEEELDKQL
jgi:hypothetical protein